MQHSLTKRKKKTMLMLTPVFLARILVKVGGKVLHMPSSSHKIYFSFSHHIRTRRDKCGLRNQVGIGVLGTNDLAIDYQKFTAWSEQIYRKQRWQKGNIKIAIGESIWNQMAKGEVNSRQIRKPTSVHYTEMLEVLYDGSCAEQMIGRAQCSTKLSAMYLLHCTLHFKVKLFYNCRYTRRILVSGGILALG